MDPVEAIWKRLHRPFNLVRAVPVLTGIPSADIADLVVLHLAISAEADRLLRHSDAILRRLATSTTLDSERCVNNVRGPVLWGETLNARANGLGAEDVFVCGTPRRTFDIAENQVLLAALQVVARGALALEGDAVRYLDEAAVAKVRRNSSAARQVSRHRLLTEVRRRRPRARDLHKVNRGRRHAQYDPALRMLARRAEPMLASEVAALCDVRTAAQLRSLMLVVDALAERGLAVPQFRCDRGELVGGRLRYRNWHNATAAGNHGVLIDDVLVDAPPATPPDTWGPLLEDLEHRAAGRRFCFVATAEDAELAVSLALEGGSREASAPLAPIG